MKVFVVYSDDMGMCTALDSVHSNFNKAQERVNTMMQNHNKLWHMLEKSSWTKANTDPHIHIWANARESICIEEFELE